MITKETEFKKYCCFYVSNFHLEMILIPNIKNNIDKNKFIIFTEEDLSDSIGTVLEKTNLQEEEKEKILNLNWKDKKAEDFYKYNINNHTIIINGSNNYISEINEKIKKTNQKNITIIDCYNINEKDLKIPNSEEKYDAILNTKNTK